MILLLTIGNDIVLWMLCVAHDICVQNFILLHCSIDRFAPFPSCYSPPTPFSPTQHFKPHRLLFTLRTCVLGSLGTDCACASVTSSLARTWPWLASQTHTQLPNYTYFIRLFNHRHFGWSQLPVFPAHPPTDVSAPPDLVQTWLGTAPVSHTMGQSPLLQLRFNPFPLPHSDHQHPTLFHPHTLNEPHQTVTLYRMANTLCPSLADHCQL